MTCVVFGEVNLTSQSAEFSLNSLNALLLQIVVIASCIKKYIWSHQISQVAVISWYDK